MDKNLLEEVAKRNQNIMENEYMRSLRIDIKDWVKSTSFNEFYGEISKRVIGQESLKIVLANVYNYLASKVFAGNNMILTAPSGCGKTETYRAIKDYFATEIPNLPVFMYDVTNITPAAYRGSKVADILKPFVRAGMHTPIGLIFLDEFDKKVIPQKSNDSDDFSYTTQSTLLSLIDGGTIDCDGFAINTGNLLFIALGSFALFRETKTEEENRVGFGADYSTEHKITKHYEDLKREDLLKAGASHELLGRFPFIVNYHELSDSAIEGVIDNAVRKACEEFRLASLSLSDKQVDKLKESANSEFGCRLIEAKVKDMVLEAYASAITEVTGHEYTKMGLNIAINDDDTVNADWVVLKECEKVDNFVDNEYNAHKDRVRTYNLNKEELELNKDIEDTFKLWDDNFSQQHL